ncbi:MAG: hypothetical protein ABSH08_21540 [Tepidisphaeraceae bacterium]|jgi:hypothetical protein
MAVRFHAEAHITGRAAEERLLREGVKKILTADCTDNPARHSRNQNGTQTQAFPWNKMRNGEPRKQIYRPLR